MSEFIDSLLNLIQENASLIQDPIVEKTVETNTKEKRSIYLRAICIKLATNAKIF